jgi:hypothetical protein
MQVAALQNQVNQLQETKYQIGLTKEDMLKTLRNYNMTQLYSGEWGSFSMSCNDACSGWGGKSCIGAFGRWIDNNQSDFYQPVLCSDWGDTLGVSKYAYIWCLCVS